MLLAKNSASSIFRFYGVIRLAALYPCHNGEVNLR